MQFRGKTAMIMRRLDARTTGAVAGLSAAALWTGILIYEWPRLTALGVICGEPPAHLGHCAACYVAAALTLVAIGCEVIRLTARQPAAQIFRP